MSLISSRASRIKASPSNLAAQRARELVAAGRDIVNLGQGEPDFPTPGHVIEAAFKAARDGQTRYTNVDGTAELKAAVAGKFARENGLACKTDNIIVSTGGKQVIYNALMASVDPGDEVVIPAPSWVSYPEMVMFAEGVPVRVATTPRHGFKLTAASLEAAITPRTKWLILNSPSNPCGATYSADELKGLAGVLERYPHVWMLVDDMYEHILFDGRRFATLAAVAPQLAGRTLTVNGVSKAYAMTGWRIGFACGPVELVKAMTRMQSQSTSNPSSVGQAAALAALTGPQDLVRERCAQFEARRDRFHPVLAAIPGIECAKPEGAFYFYPSCAAVIGRRTPQGKVLATDEDVALYLLDCGVSLVHGAAYGLSPYFRVSFATSVDNLAEACRRIAAGFSQLS